MREREQIVFVEVRYRGAAAHGDGTLSVGAGKRAKLARAAAVYLQAHPVFANLPCRFDVVGCSGTPEHPDFEWTRACIRGLLKASALAMKNDTMLATK